MKIQCPKCKQVTDLPDPQAEIIKTPGQVWYFLGILFGVLGFIGTIAANIAGQPDVGGYLIGSAAVFCLVACTIGGVLNRLERIAHHTEMLRREIGNKKSA
jgi:hypothetical protein